MWNLLPWHDERVVIFSFNAEVLTSVFLDFSKMFCVVSFDSGKTFVAGRNAKTFKVIIVWFFFYKYDALWFLDQRKLYVPLQMRLIPLSFKLWSDINNTLISFPRPKISSFSKWLHRLNKRTQQGSITFIYNQLLIFH